jgi:transcription-repair coupling factor (superfamily II helicase)
MAGEEVEKTMLSFIENEYNVLVCTSIIESGLDIPNVNTMLINQAQNFGLSDLHQMRGRVGRSNRKAFCYLLAPPLSAMPSDARKRLSALTEFSDLGSGMQIAMRDLDIRGAGDILGAQQSGFINEVGYEMYNKILSEAIEELKSEHFAETFAEEQEGLEDWQRSLRQRECQVDLDAELLIPERYIPDTAERLNYYRRLSESHSEEDLRQLASELQDRFGMLPAPVLGLMDSIRCREVGQNLGFVRLVLKNQELRGYFPKDQQDAFYQSDTFNRILMYVKENPADAQLEQVRGALVLKITGMDSVKSMLLKLRDMEAYVHPAAASGQEQQQMPVHQGQQ